MSLAVAILNFTWDIDEEVLEEIGEITMNELSEQYGREAEQ